MKSEKNYDCIAEDFFDGKISREGFINFLASEVHRFPNRFGLLKYDEDFRSEVIVLFLEGADKLLSRYQKNLGTFSGFLYAFVQGLILMKKREFAKNTITYKTLVSITRSCVQNENTIENYENKNQVVEKFKNENEKNENVSREAQKKIWKRIPKKNKNLYKISPKAALILALKSSYYLKDEAIEKVSSYCKLEKAEVNRMVAHLNEKLYRKIQHHTLLETRRDSAYYFRTKHFLEMKYYEDKQKECLVEVAKKKYEIQNAHWEEKNRALRKNACRISVTNRQIAKTLGICERQVSYYIEHAKDAMKKLVSSDQNSS